MLLGSKMEKVSIYIDFDKTIAPLHGFSQPPAKEVVDSINLLQTKYKIFIYSTRANSAICGSSNYLELLDYLNRYEIKYDGIFENKPLYAAIIDDRSFNPTRDSWEDIVTTLMKD